MQFAARFPWAFGGHDPVEDQEHQALLDAYAPGWDISDDTEMNAEAWMEAVGVSLIWHANRRFGNGLIPTKMTDLLETYEQACNLRPRPTDSTKRRRGALAAKLRGIAGNLYADLQAAALQAAGSAYVGTSVAAAADIYNYLPGISPGPPGQEFSSNRCLVAVLLQTGGRTQASFLALQRDVIEAIEAIKPAWLRVIVGVGTSSGGEFVAGVGVAGLTVI